MNAKFEHGEVVVIAVILTYNRKDLLERSLAAVMAQTRACDQVLVVDNASQDGTSEMLAERDYPGVTTYRLSRNRGAAGGFNAGFRLAYQHGANLVWMMDDDVIPDSDALESLLEAGGLLRALSARYSFLISTAFSESGAVTNTPIISLKPNRIGYRNWPSLLMHGLVPLERASFVSILVPRSVLDEYGLPLSEMFIWGEDAEFTLRISRKHPGYLVGSSRVVHLRQEAGPLSIMKETNPVRLGYFKKYYRNNIYIARKYYPAYRYLIALIRALWSGSRLLARGKPRLAMVVLKGVWESIGFSPTTQAIDSSIESLDPGCKVVCRS
ncbi:glycosyltransferase family 2 protein [Halomonas ramblicola]|uniref:glycosyltransferase family 2 protein n=1 Tax=Halomonas ramblicola TaxID=747349 RepID=UPI0025B46044|nr:glycosyltransferase family 2 protein [Halomonas ramblicola]MDN3522058.1 glycosyltransferase family 2 protein [Halomonas ramblicola]